MKVSPKILFSIDLEEFDTTKAYGQTLPLETQMAVSLAGMQALENLMVQYDVRATVFTTAFWAQHHASYVRALSERYEIASHTFYHDRFEMEHLASSRKVLSEITGKEIVGLRMPLMNDVDTTEVRNAGYLYDSSLHPTWLPGRYNNFTRPRTLHKHNGLWILPASVTPIVRIPVFWLTFKNFPFHLYTRLCNSILKKDGYLVFYVHPWEFADLSSYTLPAIIKRTDGKKLLSRLERLFRYFKSKGYTFDTYQNFVREQASTSM